MTGMLILLFALLPLIEAGKSNMLTQECGKAG